MNSLLGTLGLSLAGYSFFFTVSSSQLRSFQGKKENPSWVDISMSPEGRSGRLGGHFDRPDPDDPW